MRFHQSVTFLPFEQVLPMAVACEELGYSGLYVSDHLFNPRQLRSRYTYSTSADGAPPYPETTSWPDSMCVISAAAALTRTLTFTTGVYIAPLRDLVTVAKTVGTAAVISDNRVRLGIGVGWCKEEFDQTGQRFEDRGRRLDDMIPALRALWSGGWVEYHGTHYDVPACQMNPSPSEPVPIYCGGHSEAALRRTADLCDGWIAAGAYSEEDAWAHLATLRRHLDRAGRAHDPFAIYLSLGERPDVDTYRRFEDAGVTDLICAPWMGLSVPDGTPTDEALAQRRAACEWFAERIVAKMT
ncbi:MAG TPA: TIGR03619 family F420-dependent LLM class oxidoreductase [Acidimicrobiales bacterium]|nr:TIGR03619 family F420-dependent LLM class oxidoreductase [Acidimicrobiales bacterium]